jgi:hypothetical protein
MTSLKNDVNIPSKSNKQKIFVDVLKVTYENSRIRIRILIRIHKSEVWIPGSGSIQKFHGSTTLIIETFIFRTYLTIKVFVGSS